jgi:3-oxoadipate enol-lactonase
MSQKIQDIVFFEEGPRTGLPVVLVHGFPFDHRMWAPQVRSLSKDRRVITYDVRGHGQSPPGDGPYTLETFVDDLFMLLDHLKVPRAVLCGLSMGGYIVLRAVERRAERFNAMVLCDTKSAADSSEAKLKRAATIQAVQKDGVTAFSNEFIQGVLTENSLRTNATLVGSVLEMIQSNTPEGICGALRALAGRTDTTQALPKMDLPSLILVGQEDRLTPPAVSESISKGLPNSTLRLIPDAGHLSNLENPSVFNAYLIEFLDRL